MLVSAIRCLRWFVLYKKDTAAQQKFSGAIKIVKKSWESTGDFSYTDDKTLKKVNIASTNAYKKIGIGDIIFVFVTASC